jgi:two-component system sensor histidine kinase PilS (NtrC family)
MSAPARATTTARPARRRSVVDESWFGAFGSTGDAPSLVDDSRFTVSWLNDSEAAQARSSGSSRSIAETTFERIYGAFIAARAAIGIALIITLALTGAFGLRPTSRSRR